MSLVQQYGPLENVLDAVPTMPPGRVQRALESHMEQARLSKWTATIKVDLDIDLPLEDARLFHYDENEVRELFDRLEFRSLLPRLPGRKVEEDVAPGRWSASPRRLRVSCRYRQRKLRSSSTAPGRRCDGARSQCRCDVHADGCRRQPANR